MTPQQTTAQVDRGPRRLGPRSVERPADAGWTLIGGIDDPAPSSVDRGGAIAPPLSNWHLDWWVGADDRWYLPAREPAVRQRRHGPGPIIETAMRVPSGDVTSTAYPAVVGARRVTVIEVANDSPVPVVLAIAVRPGGLDGRSETPMRLDLADGAIVVDGRSAVLLPRAPNERVALADADVLDLVEAGAPLSWTGPVTGPWATAACLYPLPHSTSLRFVVPTDDGTGPIAIDTLPPSETVAKGWTSIVDRAGRFAFPDPGLTELVGAARSRLVLTAPTLPEQVTAIDHRGALVLEALALGGHVDECTPALRSLADAFPARLPADTETASGSAAAAAMIRAAAAAAELLDPSMADDLLESMAQLTSLVERAGDAATGDAAKLALARLVDRAGQPDAAQHLRSGIATPTSVSTSTSAPTERDADAPQAGGGRDLDLTTGRDLGPDLGPITDLAQLAAPAGSWPPDDDPVAAARLLTMARGLLLQASTADGRSEIHLLPTMPSAWLGGEIEVHRAPAAGVRVSYAIRWHGYRPALLWELHDDHWMTGDGRPAPLLRCPGLDPDWSSDQRSGETLLAGSAIELPDVPAPGDSFQ